MYSRSGKYGWAGAIGVPITELNAQLQRTLSPYGASAALLLAAGLLPTRATGHCISIPIQACNPPRLPATFADEVCALLPPR
jgi:hypothetical protein